MGTRHKGSKRERRALDTYIKLRRAAESVGSRLSESYGSAGLTESQFGVLEALHHLGPLCQAELAKKILRSGGNMTMVVDNLERRGLVQRKRDTADRRYVTVTLTPDGERILEATFPQHVEAVVREFDHLSAAEQEQLAQLCKKLGLGGEE